MTWSEPVMRKMSTMGLVERAGPSGFLSSHWMVTLEPGIHLVSPQGSMGLTYAVAYEIKEPTIARVVNFIFVLFVC